jgi:peptidoglycan/xylan/chitin deacetylase (PgdA/CDA1 family)
MLLNLHKHPIGLLVEIIILFFGILYAIHFNEQRLLKRLPVPVAFPYKTIALTFDDGPYGNSTQQVLAILKNNDVKATFFIVGKNAEHYPSQVKQEVAEGYVIGNHTYDHAHAGHLPLAQLKDTVRHAEQILISLTGLRPRLFRAPYGDTSPAMLNELHHEGYVIVDWNVDPNDWNNDIVNTDMIVQYVVTHAHNNSIVLLHDGRDTQVNYSRDNML